MRERWARRIAFLTCLLVLALSAAFAATRNTVQAPPAAATATAAGVAAEALDAAQVALGREVYASLDCSACHSIAGQGSPRSPLDGVGGQLGREEIRDWIIGADGIAQDLSPRALRIKQGYRELPAEKLEALVSYMQSLKD